MRRSLWSRDVATVRTEAKALLEQCAHFDRITAAGADDRLRSLNLLRHATRATKVSTRMANRWCRERAAR